MAQLKASAVMLPDKGYNAKTAEKLINEVLAREKIQAEDYVGVENFHVITGNIILVILHKEREE